VFYPKALSNQEVFQKNKYLRKTDISINLADRVLSIPIHPYLELDEVMLIINSINNSLIKTN
jgi:dTDP-4-amino-4,6-dideoxygalactose transaminase